MENADHIITVSNLTRRTVIDKYGISPDKVTTVHNAVIPLDDELLNLPRTDTKDKVVTFLGRITMQKGPEYFVEAAAKVLAKTKNVRFVMAGSGDMMDAMVRLVAKRGIADKFHFTGFLKGKQVYEMLRNSDVYVMPSVSEPFGISPLEAMEMGVPSIISKQSGHGRRHALHLHKRRPPQDAARPRHRGDPRHHMGEGRTESDRYLQPRNSLPQSIIDKTL